MSRVFKVKVQDTLQNGEFSSEECGQKVSQILEWYGSTKFDFIETDEFQASTKKSQSQPTSFSDMVKKQRSKNNINKSTDEEYDLIMTLGSLNYFLSAVRQTILNPEMFEEINKRISKTGGVNSLHDLEHLLDDWHDEIEDKLQTFR